MTSQAITDEALLAMGEGSYSDIKHFADGERAWVARFVFTTAILYGVDALGHRDRWCYRTKAEAQRALAAWDGTGEPEGWHRHPMSGRRVDEDGGIYIQP